MSLVQIGGVSGTTAEIYRPRYGTWRGVVNTGTDTILSGSVSVSVGDLSLSGVIVDGGISGGVGRWLVRGSAAWDAVIGARAYHTDAAAGVRLRTVLIDAARDCGAYDAGVTLPNDARVGSSFLRPEGRARLILAGLRESGLCPPWYTADDGGTVFAERSGGEVQAAARVKVRDLALGLRWVAVDEYAPWTPGSLFEGGRLDYVVIRVGERDSILELRTVAP